MKQHCTAQSFCPQKKIGKYFWNTPSNSVFKSTWNILWGTATMSSCVKALGTHTLKHCNPNLVRCSKTDTRNSCVKSTVTMRPAVQEHYITKYLLSSLWSVTFCPACLLQYRQKKKNSEVYSLTLVSP